jgi:hypothetical protein
MAASASRVMMTRLIRRLIGLFGSFLSKGMVEAKPTTRPTLSSRITPATSACRDALAHSVDSSQLL